MNMKTDAFSSRRRQIQIGALSFIVIFLCFLLFFSPLRISNLISSKNMKYKAYFDNIGELKINSPVKLSGVILGHVLDIRLDKESLQAEVTFSIDKEYVPLISPHSTININSPAFLGETFISIEACSGYKGEGPKNGYIFKKSNSACTLHDDIKRIFENGLEFLKIYFNSKGDK